MWIPPFIFEFHYSPLTIVRIGHLFRIFSGFHLLHYFLLLFDIYRSTVIIFIVLTYIPRTKRPIAILCVPKWNAVVAESQHGLAVELTLNRHFEGSSWKTVVPIGNKEDPSHVEKSRFPSPCLEKFCITVGWIDRNGRNYFLSFFFFESLGRNLFSRLTDDRVNTRI